MPGFAQAIVEGFIADDIRMPEGNRPVVFRVVVDDTKHRPHFLKINVWGQQREHMVEFFGKGRGILISGDLRCNSWTTKNGAKRYETVVVLKEWRYPTANKEGSTPMPGEPDYNRDMVNEMFDDSHFPGDDDPGFSEAF